MQCSRLLYPFAWLPSSAKHHGQKVTRLSDFENKQDRHEDLPLETAKHFVRYALPTKLSRCNDNASPSGLRPSASKSSSTLSGLATFVLIFLFSCTRIPDRYGNRVPGSKNIRKRTGRLASSTLSNCYLPTRRF